MSYFKVQSFHRALFLLSLISGSLTFFATPGVAENSRIHAIAVYESTRAGSGPEVVIKATSEPITLVLSAFDEVVWRVTLEEGAQVDRIVVNGYKPQIVQIFDEETLSPGSIEPEYYTDEQICFPGDSRDENSPTSLGVYPSSQRKSAKLRLFTALNEMLDLDTSDGVYKASYGARFRYVVSYGKIKFSKF